MISDEDLAKIAYLKCKLAKYGYRNISSMLKGYHRYYRFEVQKDGVNWATPYYSSVEEAVLEYEKNPQCYPRVATWTLVPLPDVIPEFINVEELEHMRSPRNKFGFRGVRPHSKGKGYVGRYFVNKREVTTREGYPTPIEAAWAIREHFLKEPKVINDPVRKVKTAEVDLDVIAMYKSDTSKYGYSHIHYDVKRGNYYYHWIIKGKTYRTQGWSRPEEAVWDYHHNREKIIEGASKAITTMREMLHQTTQDYLRLSCQIPN